MTMGRPSAADEAMRRAIEAGRMLPGQKLAPPPDLSDDEQAEWLKIVDPLPAGWVTPEHDALMRELCRHTVIARSLGAVVTRMLVEAAGWPADDERWPAVRVTMAEHRSSSRLVIALSRSLRITKQSQYQPAVAANRARKNTAAPTRPWNDWGTRRQPAPSPAPTGDH